MKTYTVQKDDNLWAISQNCSTGSKYPNKNRLTALQATPFTRARF
jgi:LysM repeat protein